MKNLNKAIGYHCEKLARNYLIKNNYTILDSNFRNYLGELDIICKKLDLLIIIEVKGRYNYSYGKPKEAVNYSKQKSIINVTKSYMSYKNLTNINVRFDVIEVYLNLKDNSFKISHIKDAFRL